MYDEMMDASKTMQAKYAESRAAGDAYVTELGIQMAEREMDLTHNLYANLLTTMMFNTGRAAGRPLETFVADVPLRQIAEYKGYDVSWTSGSITITKGATSYTFAPNDDPAFFYPQGYACTDANGNDVELSTYAYVRDGVTYVPMDFVNKL